MRSRFSYTDTVICATIWLLVVILMPYSVLGARANSMNDLERLDREMWAKYTFVCPTLLPNQSNSGPTTTCPAGLACYPTSVFATSGTLGCSDGDMTMFNGLLCFAGYELGCDGVQQAQNRISGEWFRSPRLRQFPRLRPANSFSPDMGLGVLLWLLSDPTEERKKQFGWWVEWIARNQRCVAEGCARRWPRYCPDDDVDGQEDAIFGCSFHPGDLAMFGFILQNLNIRVSDQFLQGRFDAAAKDAVAEAVLAAQLNRPGYSQHLAAINLLLIEMVTPNNQSVDAALKLLASAQPKNPFFAWLAGTPEETIARMALDVCPKEEAELLSGDM